MMITMHSQEFGKKSILIRYPLCHIHIINTSEKVRKGCSLKISLNLDKKLKAFCHIQVRKKLKRLFFLELLKEKEFFNERGIMRPT